MTRYEEVRGADHAGRKFRYLLENPHYRWPKALGGAALLVGREVSREGVWTGRVHAIDLIEIEGTEIEDSGQSRCLRFVFCDAYGKLDL